MACIMIAGHMTLRSGLMQSRLHTKLILIKSSFLPAWSEDVSHNLVSGSAVTASAKHDGWPATAHVPYNGSKDQV